MENPLLACKPTWVLSASFISLFGFDEPYEDLALVLIQRYRYMLSLSYNEEASRDLIQGLVPTSKKTRSTICIPLVLFIQLWVSY